MKKHRGQWQGPEDVSIDLIDSETESIQWLDDENSRRLFEIVERGTHRRIREVDADGAATWDKRSLACIIYLPRR